MQKQTLHLFEFMGLMALLMSLTALSTDAVLPALPMIKDHLDVDTDNHVQFVITALFLGLTVGQLIFGPLSDSYGRKFGIACGLIVFCIGSLLSLFSFNLPMMLLGRVLQGIGAASARVICVAITRDLYHGREMARIMSFIMAVFVFVPAISPAIGQAVMHLYGWHAIFALFIIVAILSGLWMLSRLPETLLKEERTPLSIKAVAKNFKFVLSNRITMGYTLCAGLCFGGFMGYLNSAQQIFQGFYDTGALFSLYFAISAGSLGLASIVNGLIVKRLGMAHIASAALISNIACSALLIIFYDLSSAEHIPLLVYMLYAGVIFFGNGLLFGNLNAMAIEPMGKHAGTASAVIGCCQTALAIGVGVIIGQSYKNSLYPLVIGFGSLASLSLGLHLFLNHSRAKASET